MYSVCKSFSFSAAHRLVPPYEGKCSRTHGHTYRVDVTVSSEVLNSCGMVIDFAEFSALRAYVDSRFDHQTVNDTIAQPTAENIARHLFDWCRENWTGVRSVRVWESETSWAEYFSR